MTVATPPTLWAVVGATGTGKTELSLDLADALAARGRAAEIINADAMQLYRGMDIGTAKLPPGERRGIPHHLFDVLDVGEDAAVASYQAQARRILAGVLRRGADAIVVGGSGLYVSAALFDFRFPPRDEAVRARLEAELAEHGTGALFQRLQERDPRTAENIDPKNARRVVRALEVHELGGGGHDATLPDQPTAWHHPTRILGIDVPRADLVPRLNARVERMWQSGMLAETDRLRGNGLERGTTARRAIGYTQALAQLTGELTGAEAIAETQALTRRYARRQVSWFKRYPGIEWLRHPIDVADLISAPATEWEVG